MQTQGEHARMSHNLQGVISPAGIYGHITKKPLE